MTDGKEPGTVEIKTFDNGETYDVVLTIRGTTSILDPDEAHDLAARLSTAAAGAEARKGEPRAWFAIIKDRVGQYRFNLQVRSIAGKGEIIAASEGYPRKENARNGIESVKRHAPGADVYDETEEDDNR